VEDRERWRRRPARPATARLTARISTKRHARLGRAAELQGRILTVWVVAAVLQNATDCASKPVKLVRLL
jgi:uncharacterized protein (DUF1778 family)